MCRKPWQTGVEEGRRTDAMPIGRGLARSAIRQPKAREPSSAEWLRVAQCQVLNAVSFHILNQHTRDRRAAAPSAANLPANLATRDGTSQHPTDTAPAVSRHNVTRQPDPTPSENDS